MRVLITGSAGRIGQVVVAGLKGRCQLRGFDLKPTPHLEDTLIGDLANFDAVLQATDGMECVIHLGGKASGGTGWPDVLRNNIIGTYNIFEASRQSGVRRIVYASRAGVLGAYPPDVMRTADLVPRCTSYYSVSKVFGEQLGFMYSDRFDMEVVCVRIGNCRGFEKYPKGSRISPTGTPLSARDAVHLFERCIIQPGVKYEVVFGVSNNCPSVYDIEHAREVLGYDPVDSHQDMIASE